MHIKARVVGPAVALVLCGAPVAARAPVRPAPQASGRAAASAVPPGIARAVRAVLPSLVRLSVVYLDQQAGREIKGQLYGSGTIISPDGYIVTNHHVAGHPRRIVCTLSNKEEVPADLVGTDPLSDIAVVKLHPAKPRVFPAARFGDSSRLKRGETVLAMGSPLALSQSVTEGIVSNPEMVLPPASGAERLDGEDVGTIVRWIGHDAAIYPGNSGGPLVNLAGEIVGINEINIGLSGAIPSNLAKTVVQALIRDGHVTRSWTGIDVQPRIGDGDASGALVAWVADGSPAASAGVKAGDVLMSVNGHAVNAKYAEQIPDVNQLLLGLPIGRSSRFVIRRDGAEQVVTMAPVERPAALSTPEELRAWGFTAANLTKFEAIDMARPSTDGARVVSLRFERPGRPGQAAPSAGRRHRRGRQDARA